MPKVSPLQVSFSAGELSPRLYARTDARGYREGARVMRNMIPLSQGPSVRRPGTFTRQVVNNVQNVRLIPFPVTVDVGYILAFYGNSMIIFNEFGETVKPQKVLNPRFQLLGANWTAFVGSPPQAGVVTFSIGNASLNPTPTNPAAIRQNITGLTAGQVYTFTAYGTATNFRIRAGTAAGLSDLGEAFSGLGNAATLQVTPTGTNFWIEVAQPASAGPTGIILSVSVTSNADATQVFATPYNQDNLQFIQSEMAPAGQLMYFSNPVVTPWKLTLVGGVWTFEAVTFTTPPPDWVTNNYPVALTFFQGRLWFGGTLAQPSKFWGSKSGLYEDFTTGTAADDSVVYTIAKRGAIRWMTGLKTLLIGTEIGEFVISSEAGVITPTDVTIEPQSQYGSMPFQAHQLGNQVLYVSGDGRKLRAMGYRFEEQGWVTQDLTFASEHITAGRVYEIAYTQNPESIVWMVNQAGELLGCSYDRANNIIGWHKHDTPGVVWIAICALRVSGTDFLWLAGRIELATGPEVVICVMTQPLANRPYMDASKTVVAPSPTVTFSGFGYLEGKTVGVLADGAVHPDVVVAGGNVVLQAPATEVTAGLRFLSQLHTLPVEIAQHPQASEPMVKRMNRIYLRLFMSRLPIINGVRPPTRHPPEPMDTSGALITDDIFVTNLGWDRLQTITVEEDLPIALHVLGTFAEMAAEMPG